jgi:hypothetical protein
MKVQTNSKQGRKESSMQLKSMQFTCINIWMNSKRIQRAEWTQTQFK